MIRGVVAAALGALVLSIGAAAAARPSYFVFLQLTDRGPGIDDDAAVWVIRSDGTGLRALTAACTDCADAPRFSPSGDAVAYFGIGRDYRAGLFVMRPDGAAKRRLCACGSYGGLAWSPDGRKIASADQGIVVFTLGVGASRVPGRVAHKPVYDLDWSPDGRRFVFDDGGNVVWSVGVDGRGLRRLARGAELPRFSPSGRLVVFVPAHGGGLRAVPVGGGRVEPYARIPETAAVGSFAWSRDGRRLAYFGRFGIHIRTLATGRERQVSIPKRVCRGASSCVELDWQH